MKIWSSIKITSIRFKEYQKEEKENINPPRKDKTSILINGYNDKLKYVKYPKKAFVSLYYTCSFDYITNITNCSCGLRTDKKFHGRQKYK